MIDLLPLVDFAGPNPFAMDPVLVLEMSGGDETDRLMRAIPELQSAIASWYRIPQCQVSQSPEERVGDFLANSALQALNYRDGYLHAAGCTTDESGRVLIWLGFYERSVSLNMVRLFARWLAAVAEGGTVAEEFPAELDRLWVDCRPPHQPDFQARIVMASARRRDIPYAPAWGIGRLWRYGHGERSRVVFESAPCDEGSLGAKVAESKARTKVALASLGLPTATGRLVDTEDQLEDAAAAVGFPCVTKPIDQGQGRGVSAGLKNLAELRNGYLAAREQTTGPIMVEEHVEGLDYRLMVAAGRLVAAIRRDPPSITGDGRRTIADLVAEKNIGRDRRSQVASGYLKPIVLDSSAVLHLAGLGLNPETVLAEGQTVCARSNSNLSSGGECVDVTADVHPDIRAMCEVVGQTLNLAMVGLDYITGDIGARPVVSGGRFIEINTTPGLDALTAAGWPVEQAGDVALGTATGRIPVELLLVEDGLLAQSLECARARPWPTGAGWAAWEQASNGGVELLVDPDLPWAGVQMLLGHRNISRAVVIASTSQIYRHGLPLDAFGAVHVVGTLAADWLDVVQRCCRGVLHNHPVPGPDHRPWLQTLVNGMGGHPQAPASGRKGR